MRKISFIFLFLIFGCFPTNPIINKVAIESYKISEIYKELKKETPEEVFLPLDTDTYFVKTKIIIETSQFKGTNGSNVTWLARTQEEIKEDLKIAENIFSDIPIKFVVKEITYREIQNNIHDFRNSPDMMTIFYFLPSQCEARRCNFAGYSSPPWAKPFNAIFITCNATKWTVAHEIGHYFGLIHTFEEDYINGTESQEIFPCQKENSPNCHNIMNYCEHEPKIITQNQITRFRRFLRASRYECLVTDGQINDVMFGQSFFSFHSEQNFSEKP